MGVRDQVTPSLSDIYFHVTMNQFTVWALDGASCFPIEKKNARLLLAVLNPVPLSFSEGGALRRVGKLEFSTRDVFLF